MTDPVAASGTVHWLGTGLSTGTGLAVVCDRATQAVVWGRTRQRVEQRLTQLGLCDRAVARSFDMATLSAALSAGDVVVSILPAGDHAALLQLCIARARTSPAPATHRSRSPLWPIAPLARDSSC
jgi:hypothetical protein